MGDFRTNDIAEGLGTGIEGELLGGAIERRHGNITVKHADVAGLDASGQTACANCGALTLGDYCSNCGQKTHIHRTLSAIGHDLVHGILHLDGKLWRTLPLLAFKPGHLTRRYIDGERASFVSPMAMFLFSVFAMFAVFQIIGIGLPTNFGPQTSEASKSEIASERGALDARKATLEEALENAERPEAQAAIAEKISKVDIGLRGLTVASQVIAPDPKTPEIADDASGDNALTKLQVDNGRASLTMSDNIGIPFIRKHVDKWRDNPGLMIYKLQANAYKFSWLLIPLSIPFVWVLFAWRPSFKAYDHAVFVTYSLTFMSLLFITLSIAGALGVATPLLVAVAVLVPPIHIYKQLRAAYGLQRLSAAWRLIVLLHMISIVAGLFVQALFLIGAF
ncbi:MAG: DUF3667 domain-containing protein [Erythrobacter sp.]